MQTQPHHATHESLRGHSVGGFYPYIVAAIGNGASHEYAVQRPDGTLDGYRFASYDDAAEAALAYKAADAQAPSAARLATRMLAHLLANGKVTAAQAASTRVALTRQALACNQLTAARMHAECACERGEW